MLLLSIICSTISFSFSIMLAGSPLILGSWILLMALSISLVLSLLTLSWLGILVFLIYIGGMLVMFAYFSAIQPNQHFQMYNLITMFLTTFIPLMLIMIISNKMPIMEMNSTLMNSLLSLYQWHNIILLLLLGMLLFFALVAVVKVSKSTLGPLRPFNYV